MLEWTVSVPFSAFWCCILRVIGWVYNWLGNGGLGFAFKNKSSTSPRNPVHAPTGDWKVWTICNLPIHAPQIFQSNPQPKHFNLAISVLNLVLCLLYFTPPPLVIRREASSATEHFCLSVRPSFFPAHCSCVRACLYVPWYCPFDHLFCPIGAYGPSEHFYR